LLRRFGMGVRVRGRAWVSTFNIFSIRLTDWFDLQYNAGISRDSQRPDRFVDWHFWIADEDQTGPPSEAWQSQVLPVLRSGQKRAADWKVAASVDSSARDVQGRDGAWWRVECQSPGILIFRFMCADHAARYCKSAGNNQELSWTPGMAKYIVKMTTVWIEKFLAKMEKFIVLVQIKLWRLNRI
jgi:hypothetical protein